MALFQLKWLRRFVRRHTNPIPLNSAELWKRRLSLGYAFFAWQAFGIVCYQIYVGKGDWAKYHGLKTEDDQLTSGQQYIKMLNIEKAKVIRISGFEKVSEMEVNNVDTKES